MTKPHPNHTAGWHPLGAALLDFHRGDTRAEIVVVSDLWEDEVTPVEAYYRPIDRELPALEREALELCHGRILDLGAGAGRHALDLQVLPDLEKLLWSLMLVYAHCARHLRRRAETEVIPCDLPQPYLLLRVFSSAPPRHLANNRPVLNRTKASCPRGTRWLTPNPRLTRSLRIQWFSGSTVIPSTRSRSAW